MTQPRARINVSCSHADHKGKRGMRDEGRGHERPPKKRRGQQRTAADGCQTSVPESVLETVPETVPERAEEDGEGRGRVPTQPLCDAVSGARINEAWGQIIKE